MKVVYVLPTSVGGIPHYVAELANAVANYVDVVVIKPTKTTADNIFSDKVKTVNAFKQFTISFASLAKGEISFTNIKSIISYTNIKIIKEINPDIVHFAAGIPPILEIFTSLYRLDMEYCTIVTFHDYLPRESIILRRGKELQADTPFLTVIVQNINNILNLFLNLLKLEIKKGGIIVHSKKTKEKLVKDGIPAEKIYIIPHGAYTFFRELDHARSKKINNNCILFFRKHCPS